MLGWIILLFLVMPFVELWLLIEVGQRIGVWETLGIVLATGLIGGILVRAQGLLAWRQVVGALRKGRAPHVELVMGGLFLVGAAFLLTPGVITDVAGFLLMVPPIRRLTAKGVIGYLKGRVTVVQFGGSTGGPGPRAGGAGRPDESGGQREAYETEGYVKDEPRDPNT